MSGRNRNMNMPEFSIVMPAYNAGKYIGTAIESVIRQTFQDWELVIVNDCSTDNTVEIVQKYIQKDSRIKCYNLPNNSGSAFMPRKEAVLKSTGHMIVMLDADDYLEDSYLEKMYRRWQETQADIILGKMYFVANGEVRNILPGSDFDMDQIISGEEACMLTIPRWIIGGNAAAARKIYITALNQSEDYAGMNADELLGRKKMLLSSRIAFVDAKYIYCYNDTSITNHFSLKSFDILYTGKLLLHEIENHFGKESPEVKKVHLLLFDNVLYCELIYYRNLSSIPKKDRKMVKKEITKGYQIINWEFIKGKIPYSRYLVSQCGIQVMMTAVSVYVFAERIKQLFKHS